MLQLVFYLTARSSGVVCISAGCMFLLSLDGFHPGATVSWASCIKVHWTLQMIHFSRGTVKSNVTITAVLKSLQPLYISITEITVKMSNFLYSSCVTSVHVLKVKSTTIQKQVIRVNWEFSIARIIENQFTHFFRINDFTTSLILSGKRFLLSFLFFEKCLGTQYHFLCTKFLSENIKKKSFYLGKKAVFGNHRISQFVQNTDFLGFTNSNFSKTCCIKVLLISLKNVITTNLL